LGGGRRGPGIRLPPGGLPEPPGPEDLRRGVPRRPDRQQHRPGPPPQGQPGRTPRPRPEVHRGGSRAPPAADRRGRRRAAGAAPRPAHEPLFDPPGESRPPPPKRSIIARIRTPNAPGTGALLVSPDRKVLLVVAELTTEFLSPSNWPTLARIEGLVRDLRRQ